MADLIGNEKLKLTCAWINGLSIAVFAAGVVLPFINLLLGTVRLNTGYVAILSGVCLLLTGAIHWFGKELLGELDDTD